LGQDREHAPDRFLAVGSARGRREVDVEPRLPGEADERPVVAEPPAVDVAQMIQHRAAGRPDARRHLEEFSEFRCGEPARAAFAWCHRGCCWEDILPLGPQGGLQSIRVTQDCVENSQFVARKVLAIFIIFIIVASIGSDRAHQAD
jgi:hypothetical protein